MCVLSQVVCGPLEESKVVVECLLTCCVRVSCLLYIFLSLFDSVKR